MRAHAQDDLIGSIDVTTPVRARGADRCAAAVAAGSERRGFFPVCAGREDDRQHRHGRPRRRAQRARLAGRENQRAVVQAQRERSASLVRSAARSTTRLTALAAPSSTLDFGMDDLKKPSAAKAAPDPRVSVRQVDGGCVFRFRSFTCRHFRPPLPPLPSAVAGRRDACSRSTLAWTICKRSQRPSRCRRSRNRRPRCRQRAASAA